MTAILDGMQRELKSMPFTFVVILALASGGGYLWKTTAKASEVADIKSQVTRLSQQIERRQIEQRIATIEAELFAIEQKIKDAEAKGVPIDSLYYGRRNQLQTDLNQAQRDLAQLPKESGS